MRGDRVEIVIDAGNEVRAYDIVATRNGRRVEVETGRGLVTVTEVTRPGNPVRTARFMASRVLALVEHPAADSRATGESAAAAAGPTRSCALCQPSDAEPVTRRTVPRRRRRQGGRNRIVHKEP